MKLPLALTMATLVAACAGPTPTPERTFATYDPPTALRMFLVTVDNQSGRLATLVIGTDGMFDGRPTGTVNPSVLLPGITTDVVLGIPPVSGWAIYVNPGPDWGPAITWRDVPPDASGRMPFSIVVVEAGYGAADVNPPGWFGRPTPAPD